MTGEVDDMFAELKDVVVDTAGVQAQTENQQDAMLAEENAKKESRLICQRAFDANLLDQTRYTRIARVSIATTLSPHLEDTLTSPCQNNLDRVEMSIDQYSNAVANYTYHGSGILPLSGGISEDGVRSKIVSFFWNTFTLFGGKHHYYKPQNYTDAAVAASVAPLAQSAIEEVSRKLKI